MTQKKILIVPVESQHLAEYAAKHFLDKKYDSVNELKILESLSYTYKSLINNVIKNLVFRQALLAEVNKMLNRYTKSNVLFLVGEHDAVFHYCLKNLVKGLNYEIVLFNDEIPVFATLRNHEESESISGSLDLNGSDEKYHSFYFSAR